MASPTNSCPEGEHLRALVEGGLDAAQEREAAAHLESCARCQEQLEALAAGRDLWSVAARHQRDWKSPSSGGNPCCDVAITIDLGSAVAAAQSSLPLDSRALWEEPGRARRLGHYEVIGLIGRGGMGVVLKALDTRLQRVVALKLLAPALAASDTSRRRFLREARAAAAIKDEHVVAIYAVEEVDGLPFLAMEYVEGCSLQEQLARSGPLPWPEVARIGRQAALGLAAAHEQGLIHRDVKPSNILIEASSGRVKITDLGLARAVDGSDLTASGALVGTPEYMAPEQACGEAVDHRADLFSLGSVLYALCTGESPFRANHAAAALRRVDDARPRPIQEVNPAIPAWLCAIVARLHARAPDGRFAAARDVAEALAQHAPATTAIPVAGPSRPTAAAAGRGPRRPFLWLAAALVAVSAAGLIWWLANGLWRNATEGTNDGQQPIVITPPGKHAAAARGAARVVLVLPSKDFYFPDFVTVASTLAAGKVEVKTACPTRAASADMQAIAPPIKPDFALSEVKAADFDGIVFIGGKGADEFATGGAHAGQARRIIKEALAAGKLLAANGTAPVILAEAGYLKGKKATCFSYGQPPGIYVRRLQAADAIWVDQPYIEVDGILTGQAPQHNVAFAAALLKRLTKHP